MRDRDSVRRLAEARAGGRVRVAIVGGTGPFGTALATRLRESGHVVVLGSRDAERAAAAAEELGRRRRGERRRRPRRRPRRPRHEGGSRGRHRARPPRGDRRGADALGRLRAPLHPRRRPSRARAAVARRAGPGRGRRPRHSPGLHSLAARTLGKEKPPDEDAFVCGDDADAKALALELAGGLVTGRALDAGPLASARVLEGLTAVIVNLNKRYRGHAGIRVTGLP